MQSPSKPAGATTIVGGLPQLQRPTDSAIAEEFAAIFVDWVAGHAITQHFMSEME